jgi:hypothetical protein
VVTASDMNTPGLHHVYTWFTPDSHSPFLLWFTVNFTPDSHLVYTQPLPSLGGRPLRRPPAPSRFPFTPLHLVYTWFTHSPIIISSGSDALLPGFALGLRRLVYTWFTPGLRPIPPHPSQADCIIRTMLYTCFTPCLNFMSQSRQHPITPAIHLLYTCFTRRTSQADHIIRTVLGAEQVRATGV